MRLGILIFATLVGVVVSLPQRQQPVANKQRRGGPFSHFGHGHGHLGHGHLGHGHGPHFRIPHPHPQPYSYSQLHQQHEGGGQSGYAYATGGHAHGHGHFSHGHQSYGLGGSPPVHSIAPYVGVNELHSHFDGSQNQLEEPLAVAPAPVAAPISAPSQISKSVYVFSAPPDPSDLIQSQIVKKFPGERQKHYQVVFINAPAPPPPAQHTVELPAPPEMKTQIYVLVKKPVPAPPLKIVPAKVPVHKPEVYFIRYRNKDGSPAGGYIPVPSDAPLTYGPPGPSSVAEDLVDEGPYAQNQDYSQSQQYSSPQEGSLLGYDTGLQFADDGQGQGHVHDHGHVQADAYSDYSRLSAHYTKLAAERSSARLSSKKADSWTPIVGRKQRN